MNFREAGAHRSRIAAEKRQAAYAAVIRDLKATGTTVRGIIYAEASNGYTVTRIGGPDGAQLLGVVKRADPSGPAHVRSGGWVAKTNHDEPRHGFGFTSRKQATEWLCGMVAEG